MSIEEAIAGLRKKFGPDCIYRLGDSPPSEVKFVSTGCMMLDRCIGGGWPFGRIVEVYGPEGGGKTTLALHSLAEAQKLGLECAFVDTEHSLSLELAESLGVDVGTMLFSQPNFGEQALEVVSELVRSGVGFIVIDSVASLTPKAEVDGDMGDTHMGLQARLMSQAMRKLAEPISKSGSVVLFLNQMRMKITSYGNPETTSGGNALKFYSSVRVDLRRRELLEEGKDVYGHVVECKVVKNKVGPPYRKGRFNLVYGEGIDNTSTLIDLGVYDGIISRNGSYYKYGDITLGQGLKLASDYLKENEKIMLEIREKIDAKE